MSHFGDLLTSKVTSAVNKVSQKVRDLGSHKPSDVLEHHSLDDEKLHSEYENFVNLSKVMNGLQSQAKESLLATQKMCQVNRDISQFLHEEVSGPECREIFGNVKEVTDKFSTLHESIYNVYINDLVNNVESEVLRPIMKEKESDGETKYHLDQRKQIIQDYDSSTKSLNSSNDPEKLSQLQKKIAALKARSQNQQQALIEHFRLRNEKITEIVTKSAVSLVKMQQEFFHSVALSFADMEEVTKNVSLKTKANVVSKQTSNGTPKVESVKATTPVSTTPVSTPPVSTPAPTKVSESSNTQKARAAIFEDLSQPSPPSYANKPPTVSSSSNSIFNLNDDFTSTSSSQSSAPIPPSYANNDPFASFGYSAPATPSVTSNGKQNNNVFDELNSFGAPPTSAPVIPKTATPSTPLVPPVSQAQQTPKSTSGLDFDFFASPNPSPTPTKASQSGIYGDPDLKPTTTKPPATITNTTDEVERRALEESVARKVDAWSQGRKGNLRALLSNLQLVLWENSGWEEVKLGDLLQPNKLKICYHKSLMLFHPDKTRARPLEQQLVAEKVYELINEAWKKESAN